MTGKCAEIINIDGQNDQRTSRALDNNDQPPGQERAAIENYNNKKIKIIINARACEQEKDLFLREIHRQLEYEGLTFVVRDLWFKNLRITDVADTFIEFEFNSEMAAKVVRQEWLLQKFEAAVQKADKLFSK